MRYHPLSPTLQAVVFDESDLTTALTSYADRNGITLPAGQVTLRLRSGQSITELALETVPPGRRATRSALPAHRCPYLTHVAHRAKAGRANRHPRRPVGRSRALRVPPDPLRLTRPPGQEERAMSGPYALQHVHVVAAVGRWPRPPLHRPLFASLVAAGFPSPAEDYIENELDLHELLIEHPAATYYVRTQGDSMQGVGIFCGDLLVVDRARTPAHGQVVVAVLDGQILVKTLQLPRDGPPQLIAANSNFQPILIDAGQDFEVWGVVTAVIHRL